MKLELFDTFIYFAFLWILSSEDVAHIVSRSFELILKMRLPSSLFTTASTNSEGITICEAT